LSSQPRATAKAISPTATVQVSIVGVMFALALVVFELAWLGWFLVEPLPNAGHVGIRRWIFLARAIPEVIPGVRFQESYLGLALDELSHTENLPQRIPIVLAGGLIGAGALGLGGIILRGLGLTRSLSIAERLALSFGVGTSALGIVTLILGRLGALGPWPIRIGLGVLALTELTWLARDWRANRERPALPAWTLARLLGDHRAVSRFSLPRGHAPDDRIRRDRISPARPQGIFSGGADHVSSP